MNNEEIFIGRKKELDLLESLYKSGKFEMLILHGRRRVGKSYLLSHFAKFHQAINLPKKAMFRIFAKS